MPPNNDRSVVTLRAKPWVVTQRDRWTPIEAIFAGPTQTPMCSWPSRTRPSTP